MSGVCKLFCSPVCSLYHTFLSLGYPKPWFPTPSINVLSLISCRITCTCVLPHSPAYYTHIQCPNRIYYMFPNQWYTRGMIVLDPSPLISGKDVWLSFRSRHEDGARLTGLNLDLMTGYFDLHILLTYALIVYNCVSTALKQHCKITSFTYLASLLIRCTDYCFDT